MNCRQCRRIRSHLINGSGWRAQRFWPVTRRDAGRIPAAGFNRGATTSQAKRSRAPAASLFLAAFPYVSFSHPNATAGIYEMASSKKETYSV